MIRPQAVWALARAEIRSILRLVRFWLFAVLATGIGVVFYLYYAVIHGLFSGFSGSVGAVSPRFLMSTTAQWQTTLFAIGLIFLAFDVRSRDVRDRVVEVLDARPYTNLELVLGRCLGTLIPVWIPVLAATALIQTIGFLGSTFGWYVGETVVWSSVLSYLVIEALPAFAFYVAFVYFVSLLSRNRLVSAIAGLAMLGVIVWANFQSPLYMLPVVGLHGGYSGYASDIAPQLLQARTLFDRGPLILAALGFLGLCAAVHPRLDGGKRRLWGAVGGGLVIVGLLIGVGSIRRSQASLDQVQAWRTEHEARIGEPLPDLERVRGQVAVDSSGRLDLDLEIEIGGPDLASSHLASSAAPIRSALFRFNPGLEVQAVEEESGSALEVSFANGLLEIQLAQPLEPGESTTLRLVASGRPDLRFAYLDSAIEVQRLNAREAALVLLGTENAILNGRTATLMPSLAWLPQPGSAVALDDPRRRPSDFFELDLEVTAPRGWSVAGPGRAESVGDGASQTVRFRPGAPLPEVALIAGRFERRTMTVNEVEIELLVHPKHQRNIDFFADAAPEIERRVREMFQGASELGLGYPYSGLTLVEVPWIVRSYGGGWRMDTVQAPPGLLLLSEGAFPTSRFEFRFRNPERFEEREGGLARAKLETLESFFENDFSGGNILQNGARNLFLYQTSAEGPEALALDTLCNDLSNRLVTGREGYFSAHLFDSGMGWVISDVMQGIATGQSASNTIARSVIKSATDRPEVWDGALTESLTEIDPWQEPKRSINVLTLKGSALASSILDGAGRQKAGRLLANLLRDHRGANFDVDDLMSAAAEAEIDLEGLLGDFLHQTALPGFLVSDVRLDRLADDDQSLPRYQTRLFVRNDEPVPGLFRLRYSTGQDEGRPTWESTDPVRLAGNSSIELGLVTSSPPVQLYLAPYLSLNRRDFPLSVPEVDQNQTLSAEPLRGPRPVDWTPALDHQVVVDDLGSGFATTEQEQQGGLRLGGGLSEAFRPPDEIDQGLPVYRLGQPPDTWSRIELENAWGKYRRTTTVVAAGDGSRTATFTAQLPKPGRWRVELHMPPRPGQGGRGGGGGGGGVQVQAAFLQGWRFGSYDLELRDASGSRPIEFDASAAEPGWSTLGDFELPAGEVSVVLSDETSGSLVAADALRFVALDDGSVAAGGAP